MLTVGDLNSALASEKYQRQYRDEFINHWIETQVLYDEAEKNGIINDSLFLQIMEQSKKELAAALFKKKLFANNEVKYTQKDLQSYFNDFQNDFKMQDDAYSFNYAVFNNEEKAIQFRSTLIESDWNKALNVFKGDPSVVHAYNSLFKYTYEIGPENILKSLQNLLPFEASIVMETEPGNFAVVQLIKSFRKGDIPDFNDIKDVVKARYLIYKRNEMYRNYLNDLYTKYEIHINKEVE